MKASVHQGSWSTALWDLEWKWWKSSYFFLGFLLKISFVQNPLHVDWSSLTLQSIKIVLKVLKWTGMQLKWSCGLLKKKSDLYCLCGCRCGWLAPLSVLCEVSPLTSCYVLTLWTLQMCWKQTFLHHNHPVKSPEPNPPMNLHLSWLLKTNLTEKKQRKLRLFQQVAGS